MFGVDEIFEKLLNEARSIEDIQKLLINRYVRNGNVPQDIFIDIFNADPTKKKAYARWMLDKYGNESKLIDMIVSNGIAGPMFKYFQERAHGESPINLVDIVCLNAEIQRRGSVVLMTTGCTKAPTTPSAVKASGLHFLRML